MASGHNSQQLEKILEGIARIEDEQKEQGVLLKKQGDILRDQGERLKVVEKHVRGIKMVLTRVKKDVSYISRTHDERLVKIERTIRN